MPNKQIFEIETGKLLVKYPSEKMGWGWEGITFSVVTVFCLFVCFLFLLAFVSVVDVAVVCLFVCFSQLTFISSLNFLIFLWKDIVKFFKEV